MSRLRDHNIQWKDVSNSLSELNAQIFNHVLKELVCIRSVFFDSLAIGNITDFCMDYLQRNTKNRNNYFDQKGNLVSVHNNIDNAKPIVYWSAHMDTVDADYKNWRNNQDPFTALETPTHIIGRGSNDCKAGVAQMLMTATADIGLDDAQYVFLFSRREEGNAEKTSTQIGTDLESGNLIRSKKSNLMICLENTVKISDKITLDFYHSEPCNAFIELQGRLLDLKRFSELHPAWKPVFVEPSFDLESYDLKHNRTAQSGHVATLENNKNEIYYAIHNLTGCIVKGGDAVQTSVVNNSINYSEFNNITIIHRSIWNFRDICEVNEVIYSLKGVSYTEYFSFKHSAGSNRERSLKEAGILQFVKGINSPSIATRFMQNPGRSDASAIWNELNDKENFHILTAGPGTRSHFDAGTIRCTHGPDEGFHKASGHDAIALLLSLGRQFIQKF